MESLTMEASTHAFADPREATTYTMLRHVLQNYRTTHAVSLLAGLTAAVLLLAGTCVPLCEAGGVEAGTLVQRTLAGLKQQVRTRPARAPLSALAEADDADPEDPRVRDQTAALSRALATLLGDAEEACYISGEGSWRIACALVADLLGLWLPPGDLPGGVVDAVLDQLGRAVAVQIARARAHRLTEASGQRRTAARGKA
jgi:hypothetical protein